MVPAECLVEVQEWQDKAEDGHVLRVHDESDGLEDECEEEYEEHRSTPPAVGASHGVGADAAGADAAAAASSAAGADAATAAFSASAASTEVVRGSFAVISP